MKLIFRLTIFLFVATSYLFSSGFQINQHGSRAMSLGGAFAALANDPSAIYFNPAGITQIAGTKLLFGTSINLPSTRFQGPYPNNDIYKLERSLFFPIHIYASHQVNEKLYFGFGIGNNYGIETNWDNNWIGKYLAIETSIQSFFMNFTSSFKIIPELSIGFGYTLAYGKMMFGRYQNISPFDGEAYLELDGSCVSSGFSAGLLFSPTRSLSVGLSYRSQVVFDFDGEAKPKFYPSQILDILPNGSISMPLTTPENITFGIKLKPLKRFTLTVDYQFVGWDSYKIMEVKFKDFVDPATNELLVLRSNKNYQNSYIVSLGVAYEYSRRINIYGGILYDKSPINNEYLDPTIPDSDRMGFSLGFGYRINKKLAIEAGYQFIKFEERKILNSNVHYSGLDNSSSPFNGIYNSDSHITSLSIIYNL